MHEGRQPQLSPFTSGGVGLASESPVSSLVHGSDFTLFFISSSPDAHPGWQERASRLKWLSQKLKEIYRLATM